MLQHAIQTCFPRFIMYDITVCAFLHARERELAKLHEKSRAIRMLKTLSAVKMKHVPTVGSDRSGLPGYRLSNILIFKRSTYSRVRSSSKVALFCKIIANTLSAVSTRLIELSVLNFESCVIYPVPGTWYIRLTFFLSCLIVLHFAIDDDPVFMIFHP